MHSILLTHFVYLLNIALRLLDVGKAGNQSGIRYFSLALFIELGITD